MAEMSIITSILDLVYPRVCAACAGDVDGAGGHICWDCRADFSAISFPFCSICGDPVDGTIEHEYMCSWCMTHTPGFDLARSAVRYRGPVKTVLQSLKYRKSPCLSVDLVPCLNACVNTHYSNISFDAVAYVPLHSCRERGRTYNQAGLLARGVASEYGLPLVANCIGRKRPTRTQTNLSAVDRRRNVKGVFAVRKREWVEGRAFLLIDDIMTTGATVHECAKAMKEAGASAVYVATVARG